MIIQEGIFPRAAPTRLACGENNCDGRAFAVAEHKSLSTARREAKRRVMRLKNNRWREIRRLKCPRGGPEDCRIKRITHIYSPAPKFEAKIYLRDLKVWWVLYSIRWIYRVECRRPSRLFAAAYAREDKKAAEEFWSKLLQKQSKGRRTGKSARSSKIHK